MSDKEAIDLTANSTSEDDDDTEEEAEVGEKRYVRSYGASEEEIFEYVEAKTGKGNLRMLTPTARPMKTELTEPRVFFSRERRRESTGGHYLGLGIDPENMEYAEIGARRVRQHFDEWAKGSGIVLDNMEDVTPVVGAQNESECGGYIAIFAEWFLNERVPGGPARRPIPQFRSRVDNLMATWRAERVAEAKRQEAPAKRRKRGS